MTGDRTRARTRRTVVAAAVLALVAGPVTPAAAAPADPTAPGQCYVATGKPYVPTYGPTRAPAPTNPGEKPNPPTGALAPCDQLTSYTQPEAFFAGGTSTIADVNGTSVWQYFFDSGHRGGIDSIDNIDIKFATALANLMFGLVILFVWVACWLLQVALNFTIADTLLGPVAHIADSYHTNIVGRFGIVNLALMICVFWFGLAALRGRVGKGLGEIALSFSLAAIAGIVLAAPADTVLGDDGLLGRSRDFGISIAALPLTDRPVEDCNGGSSVCDNPNRPPRPDAPTADDVIAPFRTTMIDTFVRKPHQMLSYGVIFDSVDGHPAHPCLDTYNRIIAHDDTDDDTSYANDEMAKCDDRLAKHMRSRGTGYTRILGAVLVAFAALVAVTYVIGGVVLPVIGGQVALAALAVLLVLALPVSLTGGYGRRPLWLWCGSVLSVLTVMITAFGSLAFFLLTTAALMQVSGDGFLLRLLILDIVAVVLLTAHRRFLTSAQGYTRYVIRRGDRGKIGGSGFRGMSLRAGGWSVRGVARDLAHLDAQTGYRIGQGVNLYRRATGQTPHDLGPAPHRRGDGRGGGGDPLLEDLVDDAVEEALDDALEQR
jgi:hypothetical protein